MTFSQKLLKSLFSLPQATGLPNQVEIMNPLSDAETIRVCKEFYNKFYNDDHQRTCMIGINPGRFGGGVTGIPFTDPVALENFCGIPNSFKKQRELSSRFVYGLIEAAGGAKKFYGKYFFATMFPLALTRHGKNYNYYDSPEVLEVLKPYIIQNLKTQVSFGLNREFAISLGKKNYEILSGINEEQALFKRISWIEHPRYIQQYKAREIRAYIDKYLEMLSGI